MRLGYGAIREAPDPENQTALRWNSARQWSSEFRLARPIVRNLAARAATMVWRSVCIIATTRRCLMVLRRFALPFSMSASLVSILFMLVPSCVWLLAVDVMNSRPIEIWRQYLNEIVFILTRYRFLRIIATSKRARGIALEEEIDGTSSTH